MFLQPISLFIAYRYFWNHNLPKFKKFITILSIMSVSISITALIIIISIMNGFKDSFLKNTLSFTPHVIITNQKKNINQFQLPKKILNIKGVIKISNFVHHEIIIKSNDRIEIGEIIGVNTNNYNDVSQYNIKKIFYKLKNGTNNVVIGIKLAHKLHVKLGDKIILMVFSSATKTSMRPLIRKNIFNIIGYFDSQHEVDYYQILMNETDATHLLNYSKNHITGWRLWFEDPLSINYNEIKKLVSPLIILDWQIYESEFFQIIQIEKYIMMSFFSFVLLIVIGNIIINLMLSITEKTHSITVLKSQGLSDGKIMLVFVILGTGTTMIGVFLGVLTSIFLIVQKTFIAYIMNIFFKNNNISIILNMSQIFLIINMSLLCAILLTLYPSWTTIQLKPVKILSNNE